MKYQVITNLKSYTPRHRLLHITLLALLFILSALFIAMPQQARAATPESCFNFNSGTGTIDGYYEYQNNEYQNPACPLIVDIPSTINSAAVTTIGDSAFAWNVLTSVTIPNSVTTIGDSAFAFSYIPTVIIPNSVTTIGAEAFYFSNLTSINLPDSLMSIGASAFSNSTLTSVTIPNSVTTIGDYAFANGSLDTVSFDNSVTSIGDYAFQYNALTTVTLGNSVTTIGEGAFQYNNLTTVTLDNSVTSIGDYAFQYNALTTVTLGNSVTTIGDSAFAWNVLTSVTIPNSVTAIGATAFVVNSSYGQDGVNLLESGDPAQVQQLYDDIRIVNLYIVDPSNPNGLTDSTVTEADLVRGDFNSNGNQDDIVGSHVITIAEVEDPDPDQSLTYPDPVKGSTVSLVLPSGTTNGTVSAVSPESISSDPAYNYPAGLTSFQFDTDPGATETITLYFDLPGNPSDYTTRKYDTSNQSYSSIPNASIIRTTYNNQSILKLTYNITDGDNLDQDHTINGTIIDPVGLATQTTSAPNTGLGEYWLLGLKGQE